MQLQVSGQVARGGQKSEVLILEWEGVVRYELLTTAAESICHLIYPFKWLVGMLLCPPCRLSICESASNLGGWGGSVPVCPGSAGLCCGVPGGPGSVLIRAAPK